MTKEKADPAGILRLGMAQRIGDFALGEAVERLRTDFRKLDLRLRTDWSAGLCQQLADGSLDAALVLLPAASRPPVGLTGRFIGSLQTVVVQGKPSLPLPTADPARPSCQGRLGTQSYRMRRAALEAAMGERAGTLHVAIDTYGTDLQLRMIAAGHGLGLVPRTALGATRSEMRSRSWT
jgi:DNA-binding transcriptional LysR family regulator